MTTLSTLPAGAYMTWPTLPETLRGAMSLGQYDPHPMVFTVDGTEFISTSVVKEWLTEQQWRQLSSEVITYMAL